MAKAANTNFTTLARTMPDWCANTTKGMTMISIEIENLKCGGCAQTITNGLLKIEGVETVSIDNDTDTVNYTGSEGVKQAVVEKLLKMGYPEKGTVSGLEAGVATAKSFVSCAIGKFYDTGEDE